MPEVRPDPADEAMVRRARDRFRSSRARRVTGRKHDAALPTVIVIGGLKCGTTSIHHYLNLHPQVRMSRPKELNFFVAELNWPLGAEWYAGHFTSTVPVRGESSPHYTNLPRFTGVAERMRSLVPAAKLIYMVRHPVDRALSHYLHNVAGGYETRPLEVALGEPETAYVDRGLYAMQLDEYRQRFPAERIALVTQDELKHRREETMRRVFRFLEVDESFSSPQFSREWETGTGKRSGRFRLMDRAVRLPGLRALDRNFDRLPESLRWLVERMVHDPETAAAARPSLPEPVRERLADRFRPDVERLEPMTGREFGWEL
ncbi:MAG TPA: sulfotransferase [Solirubrobacterales bacterium]|nr:sulfotransferase [Solirubrobacterales bacterium]